MLYASRRPLNRNIVGVPGNYNIELLGFFGIHDSTKRFDSLDCEIGATGCPRIPGALAWLDCSVQQAVEAGDHVVYIGRVEKAEVEDLGPLIHFRGEYGEIS